MLELIEIIKRSSLEAVENSKPMVAIIGVVESTQPLTIRIDQKTILEKSELILTKNVIDYDADMTVDHTTENDAELNTLHSHPDVAESSFDAHHSHAYKGKKSFKIHNALQVGDSVILLRVQGDQSYIVLDKLIN